MHILLLPSFYPSQIRPTTGIFFKDQETALRKAGHRVGVLVAPRLYETLAYIRQHRKLPPHMICEDDDNHIYRLHSMWVPRVFPLISAAIYKRTAIIAFRDYCQKHGTPDVIHAHNIFYSGYMATQIAKDKNIPIVLTEHSTNFLRGRIFLPGQHVIARQTLREINHPLAVGERLANHLNDAYQPPKSVETIANVVDTDYFVPATKQAIFTFAAVGQLTKRKRFDLLISAFAETFRNQPVKLHIGGNGKEFNALQNLIDSLDMNAQVELLGHLSRQQVRELFQGAHVVVSSSDIETFGVTLIEAMSCGNPIIATRSGGPEQFVNDSNGILIPVDDKQVLGNAMQSIYTNYEEFDKQAIRNNCIKQFGSQTIAQKLEAIYKQLLKQSTQ